jgi:hypothetical protein
MIPRENVRRQGPATQGAIFLGRLPACLVWDYLPRRALWWLFVVQFVCKLLCKALTPPVAPKLGTPLDSSSSSTPSHKDNSGQIETIPPHQESEEGLRLGIRTCTEFVTRRVHQAAQGVCGLGAVRSARPGTGSRSDRDMKDRFLPTVLFPGLRNRGNRALRCWREPHT